MSDTTFSLKMHRTIRRWNGSTLEWATAAYRAVVKEIHEKRHSLEGLTDSELAASATAFREQVRSGVHPDTLLVAVFALVAETIERTLHLAPFDEQLMCGIILHQGKLSELQTGEGKTLAAVFAVVLNALGGKGVHVLTFNDYLAQRDAEWMGPIYRRLGLTVGVIGEGMSWPDRQIAYECDITYLTAKEAGFDFLRDGCCTDASHIVQREFNYAIVDEADSILVDEARIPLRIAVATDEGDESLLPYTTLSREMRVGEHFVFDTYKRKISLTDAGIDMAEHQLGCNNLYAESGGDALSRLSYALHAENLLHRNIDYIVRGNRIELIDELTGRIAENRRWPEGLHAAVEVKEGCPVQQRGAVRGEITMHHFIAHYQKKAAMTATAERAEEEFCNWYGLTTVIIPPHRACIRKDHPDRVFLTRAEKHRALVEEIASVHASGCPVLVGTRTVRESEELASALGERGLACSVLNAKNDAQEAPIIAQAGTFGAVTISTNMAGRGTDIRLGGVDGSDYERIAALGGLYVIGTNRFESRRIDDQLRGRAGRQGDPGSSRFFISLEDDLFVRYRIGELIPKKYLAPTGNGYIEHAYVNNEINRLQRIIEGQNGDIRETLGKYSIVIEKQRAIVAAYRRGVLVSSGVHSVFPANARPRMDAVADQIGTESTLQLCRSLLLHELDNAWATHLSDLASVRDGIHFRRFGNQDPLHIFNSLAIERFASVILEAETAALAVFNALNDAEVERLLHTDGEAGHPSATWTYMVSDNPFEDRPDIIASGNMGYAAFAGLLLPLTMVMLLVKRWKGRQK